VIVSPLLAYLFYMPLKNKSASYQRWLFLIGSGLFLHILMDAFTSYGTGWFEPFHHYRVTFNTLFIADPFFAIPLFIGAIALLIIRRNALRARKVVTLMALVLSCVYLFTTLGIKLYVNSVIKSDLAAKNIQHQEFMAAPTPLNNILWYSIVKSNGNFYVGYYSILDKEKTVSWEYFRKNDSLLDPMEDKKEVELLQRFSKHYYCLNKVDSTVIFSDMRFGQIGGWYIPQAPFVFNFNLQLKENNRLSLQQGRFKSFNSKDLEVLLERVKGK